MLNAITPQLAYKVKEQKVDDLKFILSVTMHRQDTSRNRKDSAQERQLHTTKLFPL